MHQLIKNLNRGLFTILGLIALAGSVLFGHQMLTPDTGETALAALNCDTSNGFILIGSECVKRSPQITQYTCFDGTTSATQCSNAIMQYEQFAINSSTQILGLPVFHQNASPGTVTIICPSGYTVVNYATAVLTGDIFAITCINNSDMDISSQNITASTVSEKIFYMNQNFSSSQACPNNFTETARRPLSDRPYSGTPFILCANNSYLNTYTFAPINSVVPTKPIAFTTGNLLNGTFCPSGYYDMSYNQNFSLNPAPITNILCARISPPISTTLTCPSGYVDTNDSSSSPCELTVDPLSYTPENGQITNLSCGPASPIAGTTVTCTGQAIGAPSGVSYTGNITVTIDNGGGTATVPLTSTGSFSAFVPVGTTTGNKLAQFHGGGSADGQQNATAFNGLGIFKSSATISSISVFTDQGTFSAGTVFVYGSA
jgi:hypothetical protein